MSVQFSYAVRSDVGAVRSVNQDSAYAGPHLLVLADGMGGPAGGDIASSVAVAHLVPLDDDTPGADDLIPLLRDALDSAHAELMNRSETDPELKGLGTTCIALLRSGTKLGMVHIGDSRAYILRDGVLHQITTDHTYVQHLVDLGRITAEEAENHPMRNMVLRALGDNDGEVQLDTSMREAHPGERWLLASDGLFGVVSHETITETMVALPDVDACADELIHLALRAGAPDNVTVIVCDILDSNQLRDGHQPSTTPQFVGAVTTDRLARTRACAHSGAAGRAASLRPARTPEEMEPEPRHRSSRALRILGRLAGLTLILAIIAGGLAAGYAWTRTQYYVAEDDGVVTIFQGIPQAIGPIKLSEVYEHSDVRVSDLPAYASERLRTPTTRPTLEEARDVVRNFEDLATPAPSPTPGPSPYPSPTETPSPSESATPRARAATSEATWRL
ncbi:MAG: protein phosphatase 2C domain-containing protein [Bowdeniella nasicola]|nr:protein phosphatase 2C domain-containing protein [Bowdeniella nasicola]